MERLTKSAPADSPSVTGSAFVDLTSSSAASPATQTHVTDKGKVKGKGKGKDKGKGKGKRFRRLSRRTPNRSMKGQRQRQRKRQGRQGWRQRERQDKTRLFPRQRRHRRRRETGGPARSQAPRFARKLRQAALGTRSKGNDRFYAAQPMPQGPHTGTQATVCLLRTIKLVKAVCLQVHGVWTKPLPTTNPPLLRWPTERHEKEQWVNFQSDQRRLPANLA